MIDSAITLNLNTLELCKNNLTWKTGRILNELVTVNKSMKKLRLGIYLLEM